MVNLSANGVLSHETVDANILTRLLAGLYGKNLFQDLFNAVIDPNWTVGAPYRAGTELGAVAEAAGLLNFSGCGGTGYKGKSITTPAWFNNLVAQVDLKNPVATPGFDIWYEFHIYKNANNYVFIGLNDHPIGGGSIHFVKVVGGVLTTVSTVVYFGDVSFKINRNANTFAGFYDIGGGFVFMGNATAAIGADCSTAFNVISTTPATGVDYDNLIITGSDIYWASGTVQLNSVVADNGPGAIVQFGSFNPTEVGTVTYKLKIGTGALSGSLTKAQVIALGDQATDDGNVQLYIELAGSTAQSTVADNSLVVPDVVGGVNRRFALQGNAFIASTVAPGIAGNLEI